MGHVNGSTELGIGIGEPAEWDRGYGAQVMRILLDLAFAELRLHCVFLHVFDCNDGAMHVYERMGFQHEARYRQAHFRHGRHHDVVYMSLLEPEWVAQDRPRSWEID